MTDIFIDVGESVLVNVGNSLEPDGTLIVDYEYNPSGLLVSGLENLSWDQYEQSTRTLLVTKLEDLVGNPVDPIPDSDILALAPTYWFDFSDPSTLFSNDAGTTPAALNGTVARVSNKMGGTTHAIQTSDTSRPTRRDGYIEWPGANKFLNLSASMSTVRTAVFLTRWTDATGDYRTILGAAGSFQWHGELASTPTLFSEQFAAAQVKDGAKWVNGTPGSRLLARYTTDTIHVVTTTSNAVLDQIGIDRNGSFGNRTFFGRWYQLLLFDYVLNEDQRQLLEGYLASTYLLQSTLPSDHPYKNFIVGDNIGVPRIDLSINPASTVTNYQNPFAPLVFKPIG